MNHWWMWILFGVVLMVVELLTPGTLFVIFFGLAAIVIGIASLTGLIEQLWIEWLLFSVVAVVALRFFRRPLLLRIQSGSHVEVDSLIGETAIAVASIAPGEHGRVELRGSIWNGHNVGTETIEAASRCRVVAVDGLRLDVANVLM